MDIDYVHAGQPASPRFKPTSPGRSKGRVRTTAAERHADERTGASYYRMSINISRRISLAAWARSSLVPGMPVEAFIQTGKRSMLSNIFKPLFDQTQRSLRQS